MSGKEKLNKIINNFDLDLLKGFFRSKNDKLKFPDEPIFYQDTEFKQGKKLAEGELDDGTFIVCSFLVEKQLTERSGKKAQYLLGKKILKDQQADAGIFIFYDSGGRFRFSLIYTNYLGKLRDWSNFKRFTYFVSKDQTNKTFLQRIGDGDLSSITKIKESFSVEKVTKEFYEEIANWYFWAVEHCRFPKDAEAEENGRNVAVIRLITRMIFIWFMRERGLVPKELFEESKIKDILEDTDPNSSTYYRAILQNLFFATLSTKKEERRFRSEIRGYKGYNPDFGKQYFYRYQTLFKNPEKIKDYFSDIPFLNGGLFECLDYKSKQKEERFYIDGFTDTKQHQPYVPNFLFFSKERNIDLNQEYGTKEKKYKVRGLINILSSFNFTIDENSPDDADIALDPELLGRVFENLLASFNPETSTTARKATGSYYTPREIVDFMVTESLKAYFKTHLTDVEKIDDKLERLFSKESLDNPFNENQSKRLVELIESVKIVDPAVGSGAFPMGALNKLVFILNKVDPGNILWKETQLKAANAIPDPSARRIAQEKIREFFEGKNADYGRKLYLIQRCIYGVDIQQIAVEIAKLRFFISLLVDEKIDKNKDNWGIEPLPNLDFKIMQGNSLISKFLGIDFDNLNHEMNQTGLFDEENILITKLEQKKIDFQNEADKDKKAKLKQEVEDLMIQIFEIRIKKQNNNYYQEIEMIERICSDMKNKKRREEIITQEKQKIAQRYGFDLNNIEKQLREFTRKKKTRPFFAWKLYFAEVFEKDGFDIVIGNPPYIQLQKAFNQKIKYADLYKEQNYETFDRTGDIYCLFYEKGMQLLKKNGLLCYITSNKWMRAGYGEKLRHYFTKYNPIVLIDLGANIFENATVDTNILLIAKQENKNNLLAVTVTEKSKDSLDFTAIVKERAVKLGKLTKDAWFIGSEAERRLKEKIERIGKPLKDWDINIYYGIKTGLNEAFIITTEKRNEILANCKTEEERQRTQDIIKPILRGRDIKRYYYEWAGLWVIIIPAGWTNDNKGKEDAEKYIKKTFPALLQHLKPFEKKAKRRDDQGDYWWELRHCAYYPEFKKEKVVWQELAQGTQFAFDANNFFITNTAYILTGKNLKYIIGYLNTKLNEFTYEKWYCTKLGDSGTRWLNQHVLNIPIPPITPTNQPIAAQIEAMVDKILAITKDYDYPENPAKKAKVKEYEKQIDEMVYKLYNLTKDQIKIVEGDK